MRLLISVLLCGALATAALTTPPAVGPHLADRRPPPAATRLSWPLTPPEVVRQFVPPTHPYGPGHRGVDLAGAPGQPVHAAAGGRVVFAGWLANRHVIAIEHPDGLRTSYEPVRPVVRTGSPVSRGQLIGHLEAGHPECAAPPGQTCLHWGVRRGRQYLDPLRLVGSGQVRLLPW